MTISAKIYNVGELIKFRRGKPALDEGRVNFGLGEILTDLAGEVESRKRPETEHSMEELMMLAVWMLIRGLKKLTGLEMHDILSDQAKK